MILALIVEDEFISYALYYCYSLKEITIPESVTSIEEYAFASCHWLASITIPKNVIHIGNYAFRDCSKLESIHCMPTIPPVIGLNVFHNSSSVKTIYVPTEALESYKTADGWKDYRQFIIGKDF